MKVLTPLAVPSQSARSAAYLCLATVLLLAGGARAEPKAPEPQDEAVDLDTVEVRGRGADLIGVADSASRGEVGRPQFEYRPLARIGELVEVVPGAIATQHSEIGRASCRERV